MMMTKYNRITYKETRCFNSAIEEAVVRKDRKTGKSTAEALEFIALAMTDPDNLYSTSKELYSLIEPLLSKLEFVGFVLNNATKTICYQPYGDVSVTNLQLYTKVN